MFNDENFESEMDSTDEFKLQEMYEKSLEESMTFAYSMIEELGMETWLKTIPMNVDRKDKILTNMINWYEIREEYEKCAVLLSGKQKLKI